MSTLTMYSGREFDLLRPAPDVLSIHDIAHSLSQLCRFTGHCVRFYSVAQHSVLVSHLVPPEYAYCGLMHDITEAVLGDVSTPLKVLLPEYRALEESVWLTLAIQFDLPVILPKQVKHADHVALAIEKRDLMRRGATEWPMLQGLVVPGGFSVRGMPPAKARDAFLARYHEVRPHA